MMPIKKVFNKKSGCGSAADGGAGVIRRLVK
jgi:hypothetical protein